MPAHFRISKPVGNRPVETFLNKGPRHLLGLLLALGGGSTASDFQKLLFLSCQEAIESPPYSFVPYKRGAFSFASYHDRRKLVEAGLLVDVEDWQLTELGYATAVQFGSEYFHSFARKYANLRGNALIADTYRRYPYYATRSEILQRVLRNDRAAQSAIEEAAPEFTGSALLTIGYEGRSLDDYLNVLLVNGVNLLCDIRYNAVSRKYGFSRRTLENACSNVGITYIHIPSLGIPSDERREANSSKARKALLRSYRRTTLPKLSDKIEAILGWLAEGHRVALTCYERQHEDCHRSQLVESIDQFLGAETPAYDQEHL